jgi:glycosyltransferase involved in cell wall biosynthesis
VHYFPVDQSRDLSAFISIQNRISRSAEVTRDEEQMWLRNNVNSTPLYDYLRKEGSNYHRIIMGPYLFGLIYFSSQIHPSKTLLVPCLHDESFAYLSSIKDMFRSVGGLIFNADPERDLAVRLYGINPATSHVVGMGLDPFTTNPSAFLQRHNISAPFLIYSGRREPLKGTPILLDYVDMFRRRTQQDLRLVLTGSGPIDPPSSLSGAVYDLGFVSEAEKHDAMAASLAFVHPSVNESFSIVIMESWLAGSPVLVHGGGDVMPFHCRQSGGGLWFRNYPEFEEETMMLMAKPELRSQLASAGFNYVSNKYSWQSVGTRFAKAIE